MPKGAKKRAKLKKQKQQGHPDDGGNNTHHNDNGSGSDNNTASGGRDHNLRIQSKPSHVDASDDSMESSEETVTPWAAGSEPDEEERRGVADVPVESVGDKAGLAAGQAGEEVMVAALLPPETSGQVRQGNGDAEVHAVVQEPEVKDVVVDEAHVVHVHEPEVTEVPVVDIPQVKREVEVAKVHEPEPKVNEVVVGDTDAPPVVHEPEVKDDNVVVKDSAEVSRSQEVDAHTTQARGPAVAVAASGNRTTWWHCCGLFDAFSGSDK